MEAVHKIKLTCSIIIMATTNLTDLDEKSMGSLLLRPLNEIQQLSQTLFLSLSGNQSSRRPVAPQVSAFLDCDLELANALHMARKHQIKQQKIDSLKNEILELDSSWRQICADLETGKRELQTMINEGDERIEAIEKAQEGVFISQFEKIQWLNSLKPRFHTHSSSHTPRALVLSLLRHLICLT